MPLSCRPDARAKSDIRRLGSQFLYGGRGVAMAESAPWRDATVETLAGTITPQTSICTMFRHVYCVAVRAILVFIVLAFTSLPSQAADDPYAAQLFKERCASCHEAAAGGASRIPPVSQLRTMTPTAILKALETPGAVFSGALDGHLRAYAITDGRILWDYDTVRDFDTVNGLEGRGGALDGGGPVVAVGMVFATSGSGQRDGLPGNVLWAFGRR